MKSIESDPIDSASICKPFRIRLAVFGSTAILYLLLTSMLVAVTTFTNKPMASPTPRGPDSVVWGTYCGECEGECATFFKIQRNELLVDRTQSFFKDSGRYRFAGTPMPETSYAQYKWIVDVSVPEAFWNLPNVVGTPDAYDQCGLFLEITKGEHSKRVLLDPDKIPSEISSYIHALFGIKK